MRVAIGAAVAFLVLPALAAEPPRATPAARHKADALCAEGMRHLDRNDLVLASARFEDALLTVPGFPAAHVGLGHVAMRRREFEAALREYEAARDAALHAALLVDEEAMRVRIASRRKADSARDLVQNLNSTGLDQSDSRRDVFNDALERYWDDLRKLESGGEADLAGTGRLFFFIGGAQFRLERYREALETWQTSAKLEPEFGPVYNNLSVVCFKLGRLMESRAWLRRAEELRAPVSADFKHELERAIERERRSNPHGAAPS